MNIKEAIKTIELAVAEVQQEYQMDFAAAFDVAVSALCAKEEKPSGGWISVKDGLPSREGLEPDEVEYVLVSEQSFDAITGEKLGSCVSICGFEHDGWSEFDNFGYVRTENITHWMLLPEPPEEERT